MAGMAHGMAVVERTAVAVAAHLPLVPPVAFLLLLRAQEALALPLAFLAHL